jgi:phage terminase small subunit
MRTPKLNPRQEAFCRHYVRYGIARHAYVAAGYKAKLGDDLGAAYSADVGASRLIRNTKVAKHIEGLKAVMAKRADITDDTIATELEEARLIAKGEHQAAAMVSATVAKAKLAGLMIDRKEIGDAGDFSRLSEDELRAEIDRLDNKAIPITHDGNTTRN